MKSIKSNLRSLAFLLTAVGLLSCNSAPVGFYAPADSTVALSANETVVFPSTGGTVRGLATAVVKVSKTDPAIEQGGEATVNTIGGNEIYVRVTCTNCTLLTKADGEDELDLTTAVDAGQVMEAKTGKNGILTIGYELRDPASNGFTSGSYTATIVADIIVSSSQADIAVSLDN